jgi:hypothetical protein
VALAVGEEQATDKDMPAYQRFPGPRSQEVFHQARRDGARFFFFSGEQGLVGDEESLLPGSHALRLEAVPRLAEMIAEQLQRFDIQRLVVFTADPQKHPEELAWLGCLQIAAGLAKNVKVDHRIVENGD